MKAELSWIVTVESNCCRNWAMYVFAPSVVAKDSFEVESFNTRLSSCAAETDSARERTLKNKSNFVFISCPFLLDCLLAVIGFAALTGWRRSTSVSPQLPHSRREQTATKEAS